MFLSQATQVVANAPWWAPYLIGGTGVVIGSVLTQITTYFSDKRKLKHENTAKRRERMLDALAEFLDACEAVGHLRLIPQSSLDKLLPALESIDLTEISLTDGALDELSITLAEVKKHTKRNVRAHKAELAAVTRTYMRLATVSSKKTLGYSAVLYGITKSMALHPNDAQLRANFSELMHTLPHIARKESGLRSEHETKLPKELKAMSDYTVNLWGKNTKPPENEESPI